MGKLPMAELQINKVEYYVNQNIQDFHKKRIDIIKRLTLKKLITKNPYLFRAKNIQLASELIQSTLDAYLSSSEEKVFGDFLEGLAIFVSTETTNGWKSGIQGIDLEFIEDQKHYLISIKSGSNWGNSSQHKKMVQDFGNAVKRINQAQHHDHPQPVLGICYGKCKKTFHEKGYLKVVGKDFWSLISGDDQLFKEIIDPIGYKAKEHNDQYDLEKTRLTNQLTSQFANEFCMDGMIDWHKLVVYVSQNEE
jgi:hypothetical protein